MPTRPVTPSTTEASRRRDEAFATAMQARQPERWALLAQYLQALPVSPDSPWTFCRCVWHDLYGFTQTLRSGRARPGPHEEAPP